MVGMQGTNPRVPVDAAPSELTAEWLGHELSADQAVRLAAINSPALQALTAEGLAQQAQIQSDARPGLLGLSWERLSRGDEREVNRSISLGLLDVLTWPLRQSRSDHQVKVAQLAQASAALNHLHQVKAQWVRAVAAAERTRYQQDLLDTAQSGASLAHRMEQAGHFSAAQKAQQDLTLAEARPALARAQLQTRTEREALARLLGLQGSQVASLKLPDHLPALPAQAGTWSSTVEAARAQRLDVQLAHAQWQASSSERTHSQWTSWLDLEASLQRNSASGQATQSGTGLSLRLSHLDFGAAQRSASTQAEKAALARFQQTTLAAESNLRAALDTQQTAWDIATQTRDVLIPIRQTLLTERLKQYNGMLTGPFELLDEARSHVGSVLNAMDALRDYWLASAALDAALQGTDLVSVGLTDSSIAATPSSSGTH